MSRPAARIRPRSRELFAAGRLGALAECRIDSHLGPLTGRERFDAAGGIWTGQGTCVRCGSTIHESQLRKGAA